VVVNGCDGFSPVAMDTLTVCSPSLGWRTHSEGNVVLQVSIVGNGEPVDGAGVEGVRLWIGI
jgi:hypothetical protein